MNERVKLEPTAALVVDLAKKFYAEDPLTREFLKHLDVSSGQVMIDAHKTAGIYELTQELICNRKFIIRNAVLEAIKSNGSNTQILILAAGKAPLALELLSREYERIGKIFEVDVAGFDEKKAIYKKIAPLLYDKLVFVQGDIRSQTLLEDLEQVGFERDLNTIILLEGITHYMTPEELRQMLSLFSGQRKNHVVIDFGPPYETITPRVQPIARQAYGIIESNCYKQPMTKHLAEELASVFRNLGGDVIHHYTIHDIEKLRTGTNEFFPEKNSGWLEYMVARL